METHNLEWKQADKILIYNDGRLPENWTIEDLLSPHTSIPYNPLIAGAFFRSGQIEAWGRGIQKIADACSTWGKTEPFFRFRTNEFMVGFNTAIVENPKSIVENPKSIIENAKNIVENSENIVENAKNIVENDSLIKTQEKVLELMRNNPKITTQIIAKALGIAPRNAQEHIKNLKNRGLIKRIGADKGGYWETNLSKEAQNETPI